MTSDGWTRGVREQLARGRLLPLGEPRDGAWIAQDAAEAVLRRAARELPGVRLDTLRFATADPDAAYEPVVPEPPGALPPGPLRVTAQFAAAAFAPLPTTASRLRTALALAASERLGLVVAEVDLRVTALLDDTEAGDGDGEAAAERPGPGPESGRPPRPAGAVREGDEARAAGAALSVPGVSALTDVLGRAVRLEERWDTTAALPRRHARVEVAVRADHRALEVARGVRAAVSEALPDRPTVAVLVTAAD